MIERMEYLPFLILLAIAQLSLLDNEQLDRGEQ